MRLTDLTITAAAISTKAERAEDSRWGRPYAVEWLSAARTSTCVIIVQPCRVSARKKAAGFPIAVHISRGGGVEEEAKVGEC